MSTSENGDDSPTRPAAPRILPPSPEDSEDDKGAPSATQSPAPTGSGHPIDHSEATQPAPSGGNDSSDTAVSTEALATGAEDTTTRDSPDGTSSPNGETCPDEESASDVVRGLRTLLARAVARRGEEALDGVVEGELGARLGSVLAAYREPLERCFVAGTALPFTSEAMALAQVFFQMNGLFGAGDSVPPTIPSRDLFLHTPITAPAPSRFDDLVDELLSALGSTPSPSDESLVAAALLRQVRQRFGLQNFISRVERTSRLATWLLSIVPHVLVMAGLRVPGASSGTSSTNDAGGLFPSDLLPLALAGVKCLARTNTALRRETRAATNRSARAENSRADIERELAAARTKLQSFENRIGRLQGERDQLQEERDHARASRDRFRLERAQLKEELRLVRRERDQLKSDMAGEQARKQQAVSTALRFARENCTAVSDRQLEVIYRNSWRLGRVLGQPETWYELLRAATTGQDDDVPAELTINLAESRFDTRARVDPPSMTTLSSYRVLLPATSPPKSSRPALVAAGPSVTAPTTPAGTREIVDSQSDAIDLTGEGPTSSARTRCRDELATPPSSAKKRRTGEVSGGDGALREPEASAPSTKAPARGALARESKAKAAQLAFAQALDASGGTGGSVAAETSARATAARSQVDSRAGAGDTTPPRRETHTLEHSAPIQHQRAPGSSYIETNLTFRGYLSCISSLSTPKGARRATWTCHRVAAPFPLGAVRGRSSTVHYSSMKSRQVAIVAGLPTQCYVDQSTFFPNYYAVRNKAATHMARLAEPAGPAQYRSLLERRPWDRMWRDRVTQFFLIDPTLVTEAQADWLAAQFVFQFLWREAFWQLGHWLSLSRTALTPGSEWSRFYNARLALVDRFRRAFRARAESMPDGMTDLVWSEPAVWFAPLHECNWMVSDLSLAPLTRQLRDLDDLEPIRAQWSTAPGRFVEGLLPEQLNMLPSDGMF